VHKRFQIAVDTRDAEAFCTKACPLASELPRHAASCELAFFTMAGATKSVATQPKPTMPHRTGACLSGTVISPSAMSTRLSLAMQRIEHDVFPDMDL
jgi:hypothetical protein